MNVMILTMKPTMPETGPVNFKLIRTTTDTDDIKPHSKKDRKPFKLKMEVSVPTLALLRHEHRIKQEDYFKLDKMKNVSLFTSVGDKY